MPDREKVIKGLECCIGQCNYHGCPYKDPCENANGVRSIMADALALLKEQEAVEPKQVVRKQCKKEHDDGSIDYFAEWYCPHCNMLIQRGFDNPSIKFCYKCGKPVLWESR